MIKNHPKFFNNAATMVKGRIQEGK